MIKRRLLSGLLLLVTGAMPLVTTGACYNTGSSFGYDLFSTNDDLVEDFFELFSCEEEDD